jgi:hypothetical protein
MLIVWFILCYDYEESDSNRISFKPRLTLDHVKGLMFRDEGLRHLFLIESSFLFSMIAMAGVLYLSWILNHDTLSSLFYCLLLT